MSETENRTVEEMILDCAGIIGQGAAVPVRDVQLISYGFKSGRSSTDTQIKALQEANEKYKIQALVLSKQMVDRDKLEHEISTTLVESIDYITKMKEQLRDTTSKLSYTVAKEIENNSSWLSRIQELELALKELCDLKTLKDTQGKTKEYEERQPKAWEMAFKSIKDVL